MREQGIHAILRRGRIERIVRLPALGWNDVGPLHHDAAELLAVVGNAVAQRYIIACVEQRARQQEANRGDGQYAFQILRKSLRWYIQYKMSQ